MIGTMPAYAEDLDWWAVTDAGTAGTVRRAATKLGQDLGLPEPRVADLAIVATELTSNLHKHAVDGVVHLRALRRANEAGVELLAIDAGPGMADIISAALIVSSSFRTSSPTERAQTMGSAVAE